MGMQSSQLWLVMAPMCCEICELYVPFSPRVKSINQIIWCIKWFYHIKVHTQVFTYKLILTSLVVTSVSTNRAA